MVLFQLFTLSFFFKKKKRKRERKNKQKTPETQHLELAFSIDCL